MPHHIPIGQPHSGDPVDAVQGLERLGQTRAGSRGQIHLGRIAGHDHARTLTEPCQEHLHLHRRRVLRLVENDKGVRQRAPAHKGDRRHLDLAGAEPSRELIGRQHVVKRIEDRPQIRIDLVAQIARQETQPFAGLDSRAREDNALDAPAHQQIDRGGDRKIGLAGAGRSQSEDQLVLAQRLDVGRLAGRARRDAALAGAERRIFAPEARGSCRRARPRRAG